MGGIPSNRFGEVVYRQGDDPETPYPGLYAIGEAACASVHGANRLGCNSLLEIIVFGRACGNQVMKRLKQHRYHPSLDADCWQKGVERVEAWLSKGSGDGPRISGIRSRMQSIMQEHFSVYRTESVMREGVERLEALAAELPHATISDDCRIFNTELIEAMELENLMSLARSAAAGALARTETRGAHARDDFPERDDTDWLKHTLASIRDGKVELDYKPVRMKPMTVESFPPKKRVY